MQFKPNSPAWCRLDHLREALGYAEQSGIDKCRKKIGKRYEHFEKNGTHRGLWFYLPGWLPEWSDARKKTDSESKPSDESGELRGKKKQEYYEGEMAEAKYRALIRELVPAKEIESAFEDIAAELKAALTVVQRMHPSSAERFMVALESATEKINSRFGQHGNNGNGHTNAHSEVARAKRSANRKDKAKASAKPARIRRAGSRNTNGRA